MVIDYREPEWAVSAQQALAAAGLAAIYIPNKLIAISADPTGTHLVVQRVDVPTAESDRARAILDELNLWPAPDADISN